MSEPETIECLGLVLTRGVGNVDPTSVLYKTSKDAPIQIQVGGRGDVWTGSCSAQERVMGCIAIPALAESPQACADKVAEFMIEQTRKRERARDHLRKQAGL